MACETPLQAYRPLLGGPVLFQKPSDAGLYQLVELPCGQCILCRLEHARQWAVRITHEAQLHEQASFITLTYADQHLPQFNSLSTNQKRDPQEPKSDDWQRDEDRGHLQKFFKRLRRSLGQLRYFAVGEYGDETQRPHYHACIFGHAFTHNRLILRSHPSLLWTNEQLAKAWPFGNVSVGALTFQTAQYTASYVTKKLNNKRRYVHADKETGELLALVQPRAYMSLKPAIGAEWLERYGKYTYDHDHVVIQGRPQKPPKYYDRWLEKHSPDKLEVIKQKRKKRAEKQTDDQLRARAINARARKSKKSL